MVTAYDYASSMTASDAGIDMILVGDSLGHVMLGQPTTLSVSMDAMIHHARAVAAGATSPFLVGDMPFGSYEACPKDAIRNAIRFLKEGGMDAVKMEGGVRVAETAAAIVSAGVPVIGHVGLTPQSASSLGGYRVQGRTAESARALLDDALAMQEAGCFAIVLEALPARVASYVVSKLSVPTIGIGAGPDTAGQVLVYHDMLGLLPTPVPKFCKPYGNLYQSAVASLRSYAADVAARSYPAPEHCYKIKTTELQALVGTSAKTSAPAAAQGEQPEFAPSHVPRVAVIGAGALGSLFGAHIASSSSSPPSSTPPSPVVWMVDGWDAQIHRIQEDGITLTTNPSSGAPTTVQPAATVPKGIPGPWMGPREYADVAVVSVKQPQMGEAIETVGKLLPPNGGEGSVVVSLQNGMGHMDELIDAFPRATHLQAVVEVGATLRHNTSTVVQHGTGPVSVGIAYSPEGQTKTQKARVLADVVAMLSASGGLEIRGIESKEELDRLVWNKLVVNAVINPITAVLGRKNGVVAKSMYARELAEKVVAEAVGVAQAVGGVEMEQGEVFDHVMRVANATFDNTSSMLADVLGGRETEVDAINGYLVRAAASAAEAGVAEEDLDVEVNRMLVGLVKGLGEAEVTKGR